MKKRNKGITLVALVITIIILLILAGITISLTVGKGGIIQKAREAKENTIQAAKDEEEALNRLWAEMENGGGTHEGNENGSVNDESTVEANQILAGKKAYSGGKLLTGTMPNRGAVTQTLSAGGSYTIPEGYHNGEGVVAAKDLASQTEANAVADDIIEGKTAWVKGQLITGTKKNESVAAYYLGTGTSFNLSSFDGYEDFTNDNFIVGVISGPDMMTSRYWASSAR